MQQELLFVIFKDAAKLEKICDVERRPELSLFFKSQTRPFLEKISDIFLN